MQKYNQSDIKNMLNESGLKYTEHRFNILSKIAKSKTPILASKLIDDLKKKYDIDQATVYRNLISLEEAKLIRKSNYNQDVSMYELVTDEIVHKVICESCSHIECIPGITADEVLKKIVKKSKKFGSAKNVNFVIYGMCKSCA